MTRRGVEGSVLRRPDLTVVIVTWNVRQLTLNCLDTLFNGSEGVDLEVIVVDNASVDGTVESVEARYPDVELVRNRENVGFPRANNQGLRQARGRHVLFLNPDTEVGEGTIAACVQELDRNPDVGMVGCRLMYPDGTVQYEGGRRAYRLGHLVREALYLHMFFPRHSLFAHQLMGSWDHRDTRDVEAISGAFMMARRDLARTVGGLPEDLFMYHEDLSFCLRVRKAGYRIRYLGNVETIHFTRQSARKSRADLDLLEGECKIRLIEEFQGPKVALLARGVFALRALARLILAGLVRPFPGLSGLRRRYPNVFNGRRHWRQLVWSFAPDWAKDRYSFPEAVADERTPVA